MQALIGAPDLEEEADEADHSRVEDALVLAPLHKLVELEEADQLQEPHEAHHLDQLGGAQLGRV